jgi:2-dehydropantoate 2-reductase
MKTLIFGAGPLGSLYAHLLHQAGKDVAILARNKRYDFIKENGVVLVNEFTGERGASRVRVVDTLAQEDAYDLIVVLIRKNKLRPVFEVLSRNKNVGNILFMGNNALGFDEYLDHLPREKVLFGFPGAGGGRKEQVVHYVDSEKPGGKRMPIRIGEMDGEVKERTRQIKLLFEGSGVPVEIVNDIDGWLKYHAALVIPIACVLYKHDCDNYALAKSEESIRLFIRVCREGGVVLRKLGYTKRQPFKFNLFYWMPEFITTKIFKGIFNTKYAEIGFAIHAKAALNEIKELTKEFRSLIDKTSVNTPNIDMLRSYIP